MVYLIQFPQTLCPPILWWITWSYLVLSSLFLLGPIKTLVGDAWVAYQFGCPIPIATESPSIRASNLFGDMEIRSGKTSLMMLMFSAHAKRASSVGKGKQPVYSKGTHPHTSTSPVSSQGGSGSCKHSHNLTTNISTKVTNTSNIPLHHI